ncbi:MAG: hypothetical protein K1060chlam1_01308 [Candidatus Anoxychlamydiales bacterium]|nr:hypothetical protein [Candidatus Anoxychlamydiales bacterium]
MSYAAIIRSMIMAKQPDLDAVRALIGKNSYPSVLQDLKSYETAILNEKLSFTDDEHENFIKENINDFNRLDRSFITKAFFIAVEKGHIKTLKLILKETCIDINVLDKSYNTALMIASKSGYFEIVDYLIQQGAKINEKNKHEDTALMFAARVKSADLNFSFLTFDKNIGNNTDASGRYNDVVSILLDNGAGADIDAQGNIAGYTALMWAARYKHKEIISILLERGAKKDVKAKNGDTALMLAAQIGNKEIFSMLWCDDETDIDAQNQYGTTVLIFAAASGHKELVSFILEKGANKDAQDQCGDTALMYAARLGHKEIVDILLEQGANPKVQDNKGQTALTQLSITTKSIEIVALLARKEGIEISYDIESISSIAAYANRLIKELSNLDKEKKRKRSNSSTALVLFPSTDWSGAFPIYKRLDYISTLAKQYKVKIKHPTSAEQISNLFKKRKYNLLFVFGHGNPEEIHFTEDYSLTKKAIQIFASFRAFLDANIVLYSCSTGKERGIAELIARTSGIKTFASVGPFWDFKMKLGEGFKADFFDAEGKVLTRVIDPLAEMEKRLAARFLESQSK